MNHSSKVNTKTNLVELHELEDLDLHTTTVDGKRFYVDTSGEMYPSVTTVTSLLSADQIKLWRKRVGEETANRISNAAARRGTAFHYKVEDYLRREKEYVEFDNIIQEGMFKAIKPILDESVAPIALEAPLVSKELKLAGRVDCVGLWENKLAIIDFKTSTKYKEEYMAKPWYLQMTAYAIMVEELTGNAIEECVAIVALENGISQLFITEPSQHVEELYELRLRYRNLYGV